MSSRVSPQQAAVNRDLKKRTVVSSLQNGKTLARAAAYAGVSMSTIRVWRKKDAVFDRQVQAAMQPTPAASAPLTTDAIPKAAFDEQAMNRFAQAEALAAHWLMELTKQGYDPDEYPHLHPEADWDSYCDGRCVDYSPCAACILNEVSAGTFDNRNDAESLLLGLDACAA